MTTRIAILDDYQNAALDAANWDSLGPGTEIKVFNEYIDGEDNVARALQGFDVVVGMRERTELLDGTFDIDSGPGRGTRLSVTIPRPAGEFTDGPERSDG